MMMKWLFMLNDAATTVAPEVVTNENAYEGLSQLSKGLVATLMGLLGTFLVLALFFFTIKLMQRIKAKENED